MQEHICKIHMKHTHSGEWNVCDTYVKHMSSASENICEPYVKRMRNRLTYFATLCRFFFNPRGKIRIYFVQITQHKVLFWIAREENINRNINKAQTITQAHFVTFVFVHVYGLCFFNVGRKIRVYLPFYPLRKRNVNMNIMKTTGSRNFWICREYAFYLRIWICLCMRMCRPVQEGLYCESIETLLNHTMYVPNFKYGPIILSASKNVSADRSCGPGRAQAFETQLSTSRNACGKRWARMIEERTCQPQNWHYPIIMDGVAGSYEKLNLTKTN